METHPKRSSWILAICLPVSNPFVLASANQLSKHQLPAGAKILTRSRSAIVAFVLTCIICGCGGNSDAGGSGSAKLRVLNAQTGGSINVVIDGTTVVTNDQYPMCVYEICQTLSGYQTVKSGGVSFALEMPPDSSNIAPTQFQTLKLTSDTQNTFVLTPQTSFSSNAPFTEIGRAHV